MTNNELYNLIKNEMKNGLTQNQLTDLFTKAQQESEAKKEDEKKLTMARECLINATLAYIKALDLGEEINEKDVEHMEKQLTSMERAIDVMKNAGFAIRNGKQSADEIIKKFLENI